LYDERKSQKDAVKSNSKRLLVESKKHRKALKAKHKQSAGNSQFNYLLKNFAV